MTDTLTYRLFRSTRAHLAPRGRFGLCSFLNFAFCLLPFSLFLLPLLSCSSLPDASSRIPSTLTWSDRIAQSFLARHPDGQTYDSASPDKRWNYEQGLMLVALIRKGDASGDPRYQEFALRNVNAYVSATGSIATYDRQTYNLDNIGPGRPLLVMAQRTGEPRFQWAADTLRRQLREQPRTASGGFWHKKIYPDQMWLDGLFMAEPFYAEYARLTGDSAAFDDIAHQFLLIADHTRDPKTGLLYHAWDESHRQSWADSVSGCSPHFWSRALGWYMMALVDVLEIMPAHHPSRPAMVEVFRYLADAVRRTQDPSSGVWYQIVDLPGRTPNYREASGTCMFTYAFARGVNDGLLDTSYLDAAQKAFRGIEQEFVTTTAQGYVDLHHTCRGAGLGGKPYRDGSFDYYMSEPQRTNDLKGVGPWLLAALELERTATLRLSEPHQGTP
jgi:unsaturated rhamnogalacturonyl hydrolase